MLKTLVIACVLAACGGKTGVYKNDYAGSITLTLVNASPRAIESILIYPMGSPKQGSSWTEPLAPGATTTVKIASGNFELVAVSAKRKIDEHNRETPKATTMLELKSDQKLVFHDEGTAPPGVDAKGTLGVTFIISEPEKTPQTNEPTTEPAPDSPAPSP
jgi:hypothetical protein